MTGRRNVPLQEELQAPTPGTTLLALASLDKRNPSPQPVWTREAGAIVELLNGRRSVRLPEVVS